MSPSSSGTPNAGPAGSNRRLGIRYEPIRREARLTWRVDPPRSVEEDAPGPFRGIGGPSTTLFALLLDIGLAGASIAVDRLPGEDQAVWLKLDAEGAPEWSEASIVGVTSMARGPYLVRLAFRSPCPIDTIRTAVCG